MSQSTFGDAKFIYPEIWYQKEGMDISILELSYNYGESTVNYIITQI